jgi:hypothetical protein
MLADGSGLCRAGKRVKLTAMQDGRCALCGAGGRLVADHDHDTGLLRGMLCRRCNIREGQCRSGLFGTDDEAVRAYLEHPPAEGLGWLWDMPDWWRQADTSSCGKLGITVAEYAVQNAGAAVARRAALADQAVSALGAVELPPLKEGSEQ